MLRGVMRFMALLLLAALLTGTATAREEPSPLRVEMDNPVAPPRTVPTCLMNRTRLDEGKVRTAVARHCLKPLPGESWQLEVNSRVSPDFALLYNEENGAVDPLCADYGGAPRPARTEEEKRAQKTVNDFLEAIGLDGYEYPFYACTDMYHSSVGSVWHPLTEEEYLQSGYMGSPEEIRKQWARTGGPPILVAVRFRAAGLPFGTMTSWTENTNAAGNGNATPSAFFSVAWDGKICGISIRNPGKIMVERENDTPLLSWQEVLRMNRPMLLQRYTSGENEGSFLTLRHAEAVMLTDERNVTFPAWYFVFEELIGDAYRRQHCPQMSLPARTSMKGMLFDAYTGKPV